MGFGGLPDLSKFGTGDTGDLSGHARQSICVSSILSFGHARTFHAGKITVTITPLKGGTEDSPKGANGVEIAWTGSPLVPA